MSSSRYRPSRPVAILGAVAGAAVLVLGLVRMLDGGAARDGGGLAFLVLWVLVGLAVVGSNLRAAFARTGSAATSSRVPADGDDEAR